MDFSAPRLPHRLRSPRLWRAIALAALALFVLWSAAWFYLPPIIAAEARQAAERELGRPLALGKVAFNPWTLELTIDDIALAGAGAGAPPLFEARRIYADLAATSLLHLAPVIDRFELDAPMLRVTRLDADRTDIDDVLARIAARPPSPEPARFAVHNIVVRDGAADVIDRPLAATHRLRELALAIPFVSSLAAERQIKVEPHLAFALDGGHFDSAGTATPFAERGNGELRVKLDGFSVQPYLGYLPRDLPARLRAATLSADLVIAFEQRPKLSLKIAGALAASGIDVADAAAHDLLQVADLKVQIAELRPLEKLVRLSRIDIDAPHVVAARDARGHVNLLLAAPASSASASASASVSAAASAAAAASAFASASALAARVPMPTSAAASAAGASSWRLSVGALSLRAGRLDWRDATTAPAAALALADVAFDATSIAWPMAAPVAFSGAGVLGTGSERGKLTFSGQGDTAGARVTVGLDSLPIALLRPYLQAVIAPPLAGALSADAELEWRAGADATSLKVAARRIALAGFSLGDAKAPEASAELIEAIDAHLDSGARNASLGRLLVRAPRLRVDRDPGRHWMFERWPVASSAAASAAPPWRLALGALAIEHGRVGLTDRALATTVAFDLLDLGVQLRGWRLDGADAAPFRVTARVSVPAGPSGQAVGAGVIGSVDASGEIGAFAAGVPGRARAALLLKDLPLHLLNPYFDDQFDIEVQKAQTSFKGDVRWAAAGSDAGLTLRGDAAVDDFRATNAATDRAAGPRLLALVRDGASGRPLLNWKSLSLRGIELAMAPGTATRLSVAETALSDFFARIVLDESGRLNLQDVARAPPAGAAASGAAPMPASASASAPVSASAPASAFASASATPAPIVRFGPIAVVGGRINYNDRFVKPNYNASISELSGRLAAFSSAAPEPGQRPQLAELTLHGRVEGTATLDIGGKLNPLARPLALDLQAKVRDLELPPLSPYAIKYAGYGIERGKMSVDLAYVVQPSGQLTASNKIVLNQLAFGDKVEGAPASLPVKLAVALLADRHGVIDLDLPVSGSINDPQFSLGGVIWKLVTNLVAKAVTAPFTLLASAFGGAAGGEQARIEFAPGSATLDAGARERLDKIAQALAERPGLTLTVTGESRLDREREAWKKERLAQLVRAEKRRRAIAAGASASAPVVVDAAEYPALLKELYRRADIVKPKNIVGLAKDLAPAEMEALLLTNMTLADDAMQQLAVRRGVAVRDYLAGREIAVERLFLGAPKTASDEASWTPRAELKLAAE
jgi:uncharacterized protein involved in outer membrane biogenesis